MLDDSPEVIKSRMVETRSALSEKIETLEQTVAQTVQDATKAVSSTVEAVKGVVGDTASTVQSTVESVKETFDLKGHVERNPWLMMGGAVMAGFVAGKLLTPPSSTPAGWPSYAKSDEKKPEPKKEEGLLSGLGDFLAKPLDLAQGLAVGSFFGVIQDVLKQALPAGDLSNQLLGVVDDMNKQLGGQKLESKGKTPASREDGSNGGTTNAKRNGAKVAGSVGAADW